VDANQFGIRLKELREQAGLTQPQLAEKAGMSKGGVADLEQGINQPSWATVQKLADALGVDCRAFQQPPSAETQPQGRGRPRKPDAEAAPVPKRPRGRPRKGEAPTTGPKKRGRPRKP
jgi:transcriptional regulator with XRE-family HTH domain